MKRMIISVVVVLLLCSSVCFADTIKYDISLYEDMPNYQYDKFDKNWSAFAPYLHQYSDATVVIGLKIGGNSNGIEMSPVIYGWVRDKDNTTTKYNVSGIQLLIGEAVYSAPMLGAGTESIIMLSSTDGKELLKKLVEVDGISVKLKWATGSIVEEIEGEDFVEFKSFAQKCLDTNVWEFINGALGDNDACDTLIDQMWPLEIE